MRHAGDDEFVRNAWATAKANLPAIVTGAWDESAGDDEPGGALANLAYNEDNRVAIAAAGGIAPLVEVVRSGCAGAKGDAAVALGNLALNDDNRVAIAAAGAIPPLVDFLRSGSAYEAAFALRILAHGAHKVTIAAAGAIPPLVALMRSGQSKGATHAQETLINLARDNVDNRVLIAEAKGDIKELVKLARSASSAAAKNAAACGDLPTMMDGSCVQLDATDQLAECDGMDKYPTRKACMERLQSIARCRVRVSTVLQ